MMQDISASSLAVIVAAMVVVLGIYTPVRLIESLLALIPVLLVLPVDIRLARRLDRRRFDLAVLTILIVMGTKLAIDALTGR